MVVNGGFCFSDHAIILLLILVVVREDLSTVEIASLFNSRLFHLQIEKFPLLTHVIQIFKRHTCSSIVVDSLEIFNAFFVIFFGLLEDRPCFIFLV